MLDRGTKLPLYAAAGIPEMWLVDLTNDAIEVYRPASPPSIGEPRRAGRRETISPLAFPDVVLDVGEIFGPID